MNISFKLMFLTDWNLSTGSESMKGSEAVYGGRGEGEIGERPLPIF